jgi:hypothetical protein
VLSGIVTSSVLHLEKPQDINGEHGRVPERTDRAGAATCKTGYCSAS